LLISIEKKNKTTSHIEYLKVNVNNKFNVNYINLRVDKGIKINNLKIIGENKKQTINFDSSSKGTIGNLDIYNISVEGWIKLNSKSMFQNKASVIFDNVALTNNLIFESNYINNSYNLDITLEFLESNKEDYKTNPNLKFTKLGRITDSHFSIKNKNKSKEVNIFFDSIHFKENINLDLKGNYFNLYFQNVLNNNDIEVNAQNINNLNIANFLTPNGTFLNHVKLKIKNLKQIKLINSQFRELTLDVKEGLNYKDVNIIRFAIISNLYLSNHILQVLKKHISYRSGYTRLVEELYKKTSVVQGTSQKVQEEMIPLLYKNKYCVDQECKNLYFLFKYATGFGIDLMNPLLFSLSLFLVFALIDLIKKDRFSYFICLVSNKTTFQKHLLLSLKYISIYTWTFSKKVIFAERIESSEIATKRLCIILRLLLIIQINLFMLVVAIPFGSW